LLLLAATTSAVVSARLLFAGSSMSWVDYSQVMCQMNGGETTKSLGILKEGCKEMTKTMD
jgi:hypothetical protein